MEKNVEVSFPSKLSPILLAGRRLPSARHGSTGRGFFHLGVHVSTFPEVPSLRSGTFLRLAPGGRDPLRGRAAVNTSAPWPSDCCTSAPLCRSVAPSIDLRPSLQGSQHSQGCAHRSPSPHRRVHLQPVVEASRECPEAVLGRVVSLYTGVEVVRIILRSRLLGLLRAEPCARRQDSVEHARGEALVEDQRLGCSSGDEITYRVLSCVEDHVRHSLRLVDRRHAHRLDAELGTPLVEEGRVYGSGHHLGDADGPSLLPELDAKSLKKPVYAVL